MKVQQRVHLDGGFLLAEFCPGEQRQAQIDGRGIQGIEALCQIDGNGIAGLQQLRDSDQNLGEVGVNTQSAHLLYET